MANSATLVTSTPRNSGTGSVLSYRFTIDTVDTPLTIHTPSTGVNRVFLVGQTICDATPATISYLSASTLLVSMEFGANQGISDRVESNSSWTLATVAGEALRIQSTAPVTSGILHVVEASHWRRRWTWWKRSCNHYSLVGE